METVILNDADTADLLDWQYRKCGICHRRFTPSRTVRRDHNHTTGEVRGLLCNRCNGLLGMVGEDVRLLLNMVEYLLDPPSRDCWPKDPRFVPGSPGAEGITTIPTEEVENP